MRMKVEDMPFGTWFQTSEGDRFIRLVGLVEMIGGDFIELKQYMAVNLNTGRPAFAFGRLHEDEKAEFEIIRERTF